MWRNHWKPESILADRLGSNVERNTFAAFFIFQLPAGAEKREKAQKEGKSVTEYIMEAVRLRMEQENAASGTAGVVKNLKGDTDPVE